MLCTCWALHNTSLAYPSSPDPYADTLRALVEGSSHLVDHEVLPRLPQAHKELQEDLVTVGGLVGGQHETIHCRGWGRFGGTGSSVAEDRAGE